MATIQQRESARRTKNSVSFRYSSRINHRPLWIAWSVAMGLISMMLPLACRSEARQITAATNPAPISSIQSTTAGISTTPGNTSTPAPTTSSIPINPINTGTDDQFTVSWAKPAGTSPPFLTFYNSLRYTNDWLWVKQESGNIVRIGFTDYAQQAMGNFWSLDFSGPGTVLKIGDRFGFAQGEDTMDVNLASPVSGTLLAVNPDVLADYRLITLYPYDAGWFITIQMSNPDDLKLLLTAAQYAQNCCPPCHCNN